MDVECNAMERNPITMQMLKEIKNNIKIGDTIMIRDSECPAKDIRYVQWKVEVKYDHYVRLVREVKLGTIRRGITYPEYYIVKEKEHDDEQR